MGVVVNAVAHVVVGTMGDAVVDVVDVARLGAALPTDQMGP